MTKRMLAAALALSLLLSFALAEDLDAFDGAVFTACDSLGRAGSAMALLSPETLGSARGGISSLTPTGYRNTWYDEIEGGYLWNRCHLIGAQLTPDTERIENLITGTRYLNTALMLPLENRVAEYISRTRHHVLYRVTPDFQEDDLVCRGVTVSAYSLEDAEMRFEVYCENAQPGIDIDYAFGFSTLAADPDADMYVVNTRSLRFHLPSCPGSQQMADQNRQVYRGDRETLLRDGFIPCGTCNP